MEKVIARGMEKKVKKRHIKIGRKGNKSNLFLYFFIPLDIISHCWNRDKLIFTHHNTPSVGLHQAK